MPWSALWPLATRIVRVGGATCDAIARFAGGGKKRAHAPILELLHKNRDKLHTDNKHGVRTDKSA